MHINYLSWTFFSSNFQYSYRNDGSKILFNSKIKILNYFSSMKVSLFHWFNYVNFCPVGKLWISSKFVCVNTQSAFDNFLMFNFCMWKFQYLFVDIGTLLIFYKCHLLCTICYSIQSSGIVEIHSFMLALIKLCCANFSCDWICNIVACSLYMRMIV